MEQFEFIIAVVAKYLLMQHGNLEEEKLEEMIQYLSKQEPEKVKLLPEENIHEPAAVHCYRCGDAEDLSYDQSFLWRIGLWPHRCSGCDKMIYNGSFKALGEYLEGPE